MCDKCNDTGILGIRNGDDDIPCDCNEINEQPVNTTAVQEPLSPEAELRLQLAVVDQLNEKRYTDEWMKTQQEWSHKSQTICTTSNLHMLLDLLDASRAETAALRSQVATLTGELEKQTARVDRFFGFYERVLDIIENGEPGKRFQQIEIEVDTL